MNIDFPKYITREYPVILDIGTHNGQDSVKFFNLFPTARIFAFEADPAVWPIFEQNVSAQIPYPNSRLELIKYAVSDVNGEQSFFASHFEGWHAAPDNTPGASGTFKRPTNHLRQHPEVKFTETRVQSITLDTWFKTKSIDIIDFAWTDVNGAEIALFKGGIETFTNHTRYLQLESIPYTEWNDQPTRDQLLELLPDFTLIDQDDTNILLKNNKLDK